MNAVAARIFETHSVTDEQGEVRPLHSHTSLEQCEFIQCIIGEIDVKTSLEVGLAYGISTLFICEAIHKKGARTHYVIDPMQQGWGNTGLRNLREAGYGDLVDFKGDFSHNVLPELHHAGVKIDFAYVDTTKVFDVVLVDAYFIFKLLRVGGIVVFDDCRFPGLRKLARLLAVHPGLKVYRTFGLDKGESRKKKMISKVCHLVPGKDRLFASTLLKTDSDLGVNAHCIAFQKVADDDPRNWDWFEEF